MGMGMGMGMGGGGPGPRHNGGHTYEWIDEEWLASYLESGQVIEAVLGDSDPSGTREASRDGLKGDQAADQVCVWTLCGVLVSYSSMPGVTCACEAKT